MIHLTRHAIARYIERVAPCSEDEARRALSSPIIVKAAQFGAHCVRLGTGQRIVIHDHSVVTVLPADRKRRKFQARGF